MSNSFRKITYAYDNPDYCSVCRVKPTDGDGWYSKGHTFLLWDALLNRVRDSGKIIRVLITPIV